MDTRLRELERQANNDPDALNRLIVEKMRLGYQEKEESLARPDIDCGTTLSLEELQQLINSQVTAKKRAKFHDIKLRFYINTPGYIDNHYVDEMDCSISLNIIGIRLESDKELKHRLAVEKRIENDLMRRAAAEKAEKKHQKELRKQCERAEYERLKKKFEAEEQTQKLLEALGNEAVTALNSYRPQYYKSWFSRKFKKLGGKTPLEVFKEGDIEKLRSLVLKQL